MPGIVVAAVRLAYEFRSDTVLKKSSEKYSEEKASIYLFTGRTKGTRYPDRCDKFGGSEHGINIASVKVRTAHK